MAQAPAGPYLVSVWTFPPTITTGNLHLTVVVTDASSHAPVSDAQVQAALVAAGSESPVTSGNAVGTPDPLAGFLYEVILPAEEVGEYEVQVTVADAAGVQGNLAFAIEVGSAFGMQLLIYFLSLQVIITAIWLLWEGRVTWSGGLLRLSRSPA